MFVVELDEGLVALIAMDCGPCAAEMGSDPFQFECLDISRLAAMQRAMCNLNCFTGEAQADGLRMARAGELLRADYALIAWDCM